VVVLSGTKTVNTAVEAMKRGAADYVTKPFEVEALRFKVRKLLERRELEREVVALRARLEPEEGVGELLGSSEPMQAVFRTIRRVATSPATVVIRGESGTGKELAARAIHALGPRADKPFVAVHCGGIPETLIESELFGHERGAFTDAREQRIGRFEAADGGTLFLDEIGELALDVQAKLLRALQERVVERLGGQEPIPVNVRVLAATHRDLERGVREGRFREDLFYRIHVVPLLLPPLRERGDDVKQLAHHFLELARSEAGRGPMRLARETLLALERFAWPGNVRELRNVIERGVALAEGDVLELADLPPHIVRANQIDELQRAVRSGELGFDDASAQFESDLLREALTATGGNQTRAARRLGLTRRALKLKLDRYGIKPEG
jgi:DNA-binding NtrC family response regulator